MRTLTIAILNFNSGEYLKKCLLSIKGIEEEANIKIIAIDNESTDDSFNLNKSDFPGVEFVKNGENLGFSKGYNEVLRKIKSEFVLLLNPDCILRKGVIKKILND